MKDDARAWLESNRCPWCRHRRGCRRDKNAEPKLGGGWKCRSYSCDENRRFSA